jgi:hypothetical protein
MHAIVLLLIIIVLVLIAGPGFVVGSIALFGIWIATLWKTVAAIVLVPVIAAIGLLIWSMFKYRARKLPTAGFGFPLSDEFKQKNKVEDGIWKDDLHFLVELKGRTNYFKTIEEARFARDTGIVR